MLDISVKTFNELTTTALYELLQLRSEVFVVEQECAYQDLDGKDLKAIHIIGTEHDEIVAYARIFKAGDYFPQACIGRVVVKKGARKHGYGVEIMKTAIKVLEEDLGASTIALSAQTYLKAFYNSLGFWETGGEYLEDGIAHVMMVKN